MCNAVSFWHENMTNFCTLYFHRLSYISTGGHQMTWNNHRCLKVKWPFEDFILTLCPTRLKSAVSSEIHFVTLNTASYFVHHGIGAGLLLVSPSIWCDTLHDRVWHLSRLVPWKVGISLFERIIEQNCRSFMVIGHSPAVWSARSVSMFCA